MEFSPTSPNYIPALRDTVTCVQARTVPHTTQTGASLQRVRTGCFHLEVCAESCYLGRLGDDTPPLLSRASPIPGDREPATEVQTEGTSKRGQL